MWTLKDAGIDGSAFWRYVEEQVYTLPGTDRHREVFSVLVTGSRAFGAHTERSDIDIDVVCPGPMYESVLRASVAAGRGRAERSLFCYLQGDDWARYFGERFGRPHFCVTPLHVIERQVRDYEDVPLWIWTNAKVVTDPGHQFQRIIERFTGYPKDVLVQKIKYRWLLAGYWEVDCYPHHHGEDARDVLPAAAALLNAVNELLRLCFLVEGRPFPYAEKLMRLAPRMQVGQTICPILQKVADLVVGVTTANVGVWERLDRACDILTGSQSSEDCRRIEEACGQAMIAAGVDPKWVAADYHNIQELLTGLLGPLP